ncbi:uncharacterized protein LOC134277220 [Saccostrea cucullata]|uniref:uncharacterized protein LOC134277220 n=1 Tax=Saccostrea cuccullata TaxID=36930 RepID=UPI002ED26650
MNILVIPLTTIICFEYCLASNIHLENINTNKGQFTSPGYPANYPDNTNYTWIIRTGHTAANVTFRIHDMNIRNTNPCDDYLEIKEVEPCCFTVFKRCGELKDMAVYTRGNQIRVSFISDRILNAKGFNLSWTVALQPTTPRLKVTTIRTTTPSKTSVRIYPSKSTRKLTTNTTSRTASTAKKLTTISTTTTMMTTTPRTSTTTTTAKMTITTKLKTPSTKKLMRTSTTKSFSTTLQMTTSPTEEKTYDITTIKTTLSSSHLSGTFIFGSSTLPDKKSAYTLHAKFGIALSPKTVTNAWASYGVTEKPEVRAESGVTATQALTSIPIIENSATLGITSEDDSSNKTFLDSYMHIIIGVCAFEVILVIIGVVVGKRFCSRASKKSPLPGTAVTDGLNATSMEKCAHNVYESIPLEHFNSSDANEFDEGVYVEYPDNVYDRSFVRRTHAFRNNVYETNEAIYNVSFSKQNHDILQGSNIYQPCELTTFLKQEENCEQKC